MRGRPIRETGSVRRTMAKTSKGEAIESSSVAFIVLRADAWTLEGGGGRGIGDNSVVWRGLPS